MRVKEARLVHTGDIIEPVKRAGWIFGVYKYGPIAYDGNELFVDRVIAR